MRMVEVSVIVRPGFFEIFQRYSGGARSGLCGSGCWFRSFPGGSVP